jgi:4-carboxymuconolactone decarboxylase
MGMPAGSSSVHGVAGYFLGPPLEEAVIQEELGSNQRFNLPKAISNATKKGGQMVKLPRPYEWFKANYPEIWQAYDKLAALSHGAGPLGAKERELVKLAMAIGARREGAVHSHTRRALAEGATKEEICHLVLMGLTTLGFPSTIAALTWVKDELDGRVRSRIGGRRGVVVSERVARRKR